MVVIREDTLLQKITRPCPFTHRSTSINSTFRIIYLSLQFCRSIDSFCRDAKYLKVLTSQCHSYFKRIKIFIGNKMYLICYGALYQLYSSITKFYLSYIQFTQNQLKNASYILYEKPSSALFSFKLTSMNFLV